MTDVSTQRTSLYDDIPCILAETSTLSTRGIDCALYKWSPPDKDAPIRGVAVVYHGFGAHSLYPTVRYASSLLAENGILVYGLDFPGHGASPGKRGLLTSVDDLIEGKVPILISCGKFTPSLNLSMILANFRWGHGGNPCDNGLVQKWRFAAVPRRVQVKNIAPQSNYLFVVIDNEYFSIAAWGGRYL